MTIRISRMSGACGALAVVGGLAGMARAALILNGDVTDPGDPIVGVAAMVGSATSTASTVGTVAATNNYPAAEAPSAAIDNDLSTASKYLNFQMSGAGFITTITGNGPQASLTGFRFNTGNDAPERDPATITIEGTNSPNATTTLNSTWTTLYNGVSGLATDPGRTTLGPLVTITPTAAFRSFRVLVASVRTPGTANSFQFGELDLIGNSVVPEPASAGLLGLAGMGLLARRRRNA